MMQSDPPEPGRPVDPVNQQHLTCGADTDELLEQVADGQGEELTEHQRGCRYCQAALGEFAELWAPVAEAAALPVAVPAGAAAAMIAAVMGEARAAASSGSTAAPGGPPPGRIPHLGRWISLLAGVVAIAAIITAIVLVTRPDNPTTAPGTRGVISTPTVTATAPRATGGATSPVPSSSAVVPTSPRTGLPTAVPAGSGGQAATSTSDTHVRRRALFGAGALLAGLSGLYLVRGRRPDRRRLRR